MNDFFNFTKKEIDFERNMSTEIWEDAEIERKNESEF